VNFTGATMTKAQLANAKHANFDNAQLNGAFALGTDFRQAYFYCATLNGARVMSDSSRMLAIHRETPKPSDTSTH
jgi:uncharacterized protein YjbI with pentapeptide repeats